VNRPRYAALLATALACITGGAACLVDDLDLSELSCPCGAGSVCVCDRCVPEDEAASTDCGGTGGSAPWFDASYAKRIRIDVAAPEEDLDGFVVLVRLDATRIDYAAVADNGSDLVFVAADGETTLAHEVDTWDPSGTSVVWVAVDQIAAEGTHFSLYWGNPDAVDLQDAAATWARDYSAVWHMDEALVDATPNANNGTNAGSVDVEGWLGRARDFDGMDDFIDAGSDASLDDVFSNGGTITAWIRANSFGGLDFGRIADKSAGIDGTGGWGFELDNAAGNADQTLRFERGFDTNVSAWFGPQSIIVVGQWHAVGMVYDESTGDPPRFFVDGVAQPASDDGLGSGAPTADGAQSLRIGNHAVGARGFDGIIDELRIATVPRTNAFMAAQHASMIDALLTYQTEEQRPL
jgi:hypothetical protein